MIQTAEIKKKFGGFMIADNLNPEEYGRQIDWKTKRSLHDMSEPFILYLASPFVKPQMDSAVTAKCKAIVGLKCFPFTNDITYSMRFALTSHIPFKAVRLSKEYLQRYVLYKGCICFNLAEPEEQQKLLVVHIPVETKKLNLIDLSDDPYVVGISSNTVDLSDIHGLKFSGHVYGENKNRGDFRKIRYQYSSKTCCYTNNRIY